jgi:hypothetical protein
MRELPFYVAQFYGLGQAESELTSLILRHIGRVAFVTKCGFGNLLPPSSFVHHQAGLRGLLRMDSVLHRLVRCFHPRALVLLAFSVASYRFSLQTSPC